MKAKKRTVFDRLMTAFRARDEDAFAAELEEAKAKDEGEGEQPEPEAQETQDVPSLPEMIERIAAMEAKIDRLLAAKAEPEVQDEAPEEEAKDEDDETCEPAKVGDAIARAEILSPGIKAPVKATARALDSFKALALAGADAAVVAPFGDVAALKGPALDAVFIAASELAKARNNGKPARVADRHMVSSIADINARNRAFWQQ